MNKNKININIILILVCIFLCICVLCVSIVIPKYLIKRSNDEAIVKYGEYKHYVYGDTFYATIEKIEKEKDKIFMYIKGLEVNDINHRGEYHFSIDEDTKLLMWGYNIDNKIKLSDFKKGQKISITSIGSIIKTTGLIPKVVTVNLLEDKK